MEPRAWSLEKKEELSQLVPQGGRGIPEKHKGPLSLENLVGEGVVVKPEMVRTDPAKRESSAKPNPESEATREQQDYFAFTPLRPCAVTPLK